MTAALGRSPIQPMRDPFPSRVSRAGMRPSMRFEKPGKLAILEAALAWYFDPPEPEPPFREEAGIAIVTVCGPMMHHKDWWWESYEDIAARVTAALQSSSTAVLMCIDSPGGELAGCFEMVREIRAQADRSGKPLIAYVNGMAASGGYALACAADKIFVPETGRVGSIGVIDALIDVTGFDRQMGVSWAVIASGARKTDGHPHVPISDDAKAAVQTEVDGLAQIFFALVAERRGISVDDVAALQAGIVHGEAAVTARLADGVARLSEVIAQMSGGKKKPAAAGAAKAKPAKEQTMKIASYDDIMGQLKQLADEESDDGKKAKDALEKLNAPPPEKKDGEEDDGDDKDKEAHATVGKLLVETGTKSVDEAFKVLSRVMASVVTSEEDAQAKESARRLEIVGELVKLGVETPATAWAEGPKGEPADIKFGPSAMYASMPIADLEKRLKTMTALHGGKRPALPPRVAPPKKAGAGVELTERELEKCKRKGIDPERYAAVKASIVTNQSSSNGG